MMKKNFKIGCISIIVLVAIINPITLLLLRGIIGYWSYKHPDTGQHVKKVSWLPEEATNISYYKSYYFTAYEFDIPEGGFKKWASDYKYKKIVTPIKIPRFNYCTKREPQKAEESIEQRLERYSKYLATVSNGFIYEKRYSNGGATIVAYDLDKERAYFQSNPN